MKSDLLFSLLEEHASISLAGMCKNAGKTTVLNRLLKELGEHEIPIGITSIGRDGESTDVVTGTYKPRIYVREGTLFATAAGLLHNCDTTSEILRTTGIHTPLGEVVLLRAVSDGFIDLAGPSMNQQLVEISGMFREYPIGKILIDGAISRKSLCSRRVADAVILCTGASYHTNMRTVIEDTAYISRLLQLKGMANEKLEASIQAWRQQRGSGEKLLFLNPDGERRTVEPGQRLVDAMRDKKNAGYPVVWMEGAVTDALLRPLLMSNISCKGIYFMAEDSSKLLLSRDVYEKLLQKGGQLTVLEEIHLLAVTINPFSAYGNHFDKQEFAEQMKAAVNLPVVNVLEDM